MDRYPWIFPLVLLGIFGTFLYRRLRYGSWIGAFLGGTVQSVVGEVTLRSSGFSSSTLKVASMRANSSESFVALTVVSKAAFAASMTPLKLTREQALSLAELLQRAATNFVP